MSSNLIPYIIIEARPGSYLPSIRYTKGIIEEYKVKIGTITKKNGELENLLKKKTLAIKELEETNNAPTQNEEADLISIIENCIQEIF